MGKKKQIEEPKVFEAFEARRLELERQKGIPVHAIIVPLDDDGKDWTCGFIRDPERPTVEACLSLQSQGSVIGSTEVLIRSSWIEGDERIMEEDALLYSAHTVVREIVTFRLGVLKKSSINTLSTSGKSTTK